MKNVFLVPNCLSTNGEYIFWKLKLNFDHYFDIFLFTLLFTPGASLPVLGPFLAGGVFGSET